MLSDLQDVRVHGLPLGKRWRREHVLVHRTPARVRQRHHPSLILPRIPRKGTICSLVSLGLSQQWHMRAGRGGGQSSLHADFVSPDDEGHLAAPGVDEAGPAGVQGDIFSVAGAEPDGGVVKRLAAELEDCHRWGMTW